MITTANFSSFFESRKKTLFPTFGIHAFLVVLFAFIGLKSNAQTVDFNVTRVCLGQHSNFTAISSLADSSIAQWYWDFDNNGSFLDDSGKVVTFAFTTADTFPVNLMIKPKVGPTITMNQAKDVLVDPVPEVNFQADNLCEGIPANYTSTSAIASGTIAQYLWDFNNDQVVDDNSGPVVSYTVGPAASYVSRLTCISDQGCEAFTTKTTTVFPRPQADFEVEGPCVGLPVNFIDRSTITGDSISYLVWTFGDGTSDITFGGIQHTYAATGQQNVVLESVSWSNCRDTISLPLTIVEPEVVSVEVAGDTFLYAGNQVDILVNGLVSNYQWSGGEITDRITVDQAGTYSVVITDPNGCQQSFSRIITERTFGGVSVVSTILTPNGDGINDQLLIENVTAGETCEISIFNRWNEMVYSNSGYQNDWQGTYEGKTLDAGAYFYVVRCGDQPEKVGTINILH